MTIRVLSAFSILLCAAGVARAQSLLGESDASPYDPPKRPAYRRHDFIRIQVPVAGQAGDSAEARRAEGRGARRQAASRETVFHVTVEVADVRPNGTLVIQAIRRRRVGDKEEVVRLTGELAPSAVADGAARLEDVHNLNVTYDGPALAADLGRDGHLGGLLGRAWPH